MIAKEMTQVVAYVPKTLKRRMRTIRRADPRWSESRMVNSALDKVLPLIEAEVLPTQEPPGSSNQTAA